MQKLLLMIIYSVILRWFLKIIVGVKFATAKFLLNEKQFIIVANHNSHLDTMTIMASIPSKIINKVRPVAAADHFGKTKLKEKLTKFLVNALLIKRKRDKDNPQQDPINLMIQALDAGYSLIVFPEGTRGEPEIQQPLKPGIAYVLMKRPQIKYVPAYLIGMGHAMPKNDNLIVPYISKLVYGAPVLIKSLEIDEILKQIDDDLKQLKGKNV